MAKVIPATNRTDLFAQAHGITVQELVRYNLHYFQANVTCWLPVGYDFRTEPPAPLAGSDVIVNGSLLVVNGFILNMRPGGI